MKKYVIGITALCLAGCSTAAPESTAAVSTVPAQAESVWSHDAFAQKAAEESIVLLKNEGILPLKQTDRIAVIGPFAEHPFIQGSGSSRVNPINQDSLLSDLDAHETAYTYSQGFSLENEEIDEALHAGCHNSDWLAFPSACVSLDTPDIVDKLWIL